MTVLQLPSKRKDFIKKKKTNWVVRNKSRVGLNSLSVAVRFSTLS